MSELSKGRCFGYALSTIRDDRRFQQRAEAAVAQEYEARFSESHRWGGVFLDLKYIEFSPLFSRPAGKEMLAKAARGDVIVFPYLDRSFKNLKDFTDAVVQFRLKGVRLVISEIGLDTMTHQDLLAMIERLVQFDRESRRRNFVEAIKDNWQEGKATPGRRPPIGFRNMKTDDQGTFVVGDPEQRELMGRMLEWAESGWTPQQVAARLNLDGVPNMEGNPWNKVTAHHWIIAEQVIRAYEAAQHCSMNGKVCPADLREMLRQDVVKEIRAGHRPVPDFK